MTVGRALVAASSIALLVLAPACGPGAPAQGTTAKAAPAPAWQDVFDTMPDIYVVARPQAIKRDAVYGTFWKTLVRIAEARRIVTGPSTLEAVEGAEEIIFGLNPGMDPAIVLRGVPAHLDPQKVTGEGGRPLFRLVDERAKVPEYQLDDPRAPEAGSMFVLPDRTWVGAFGDARQRARTAFASPFGRPAPRVSPEALGVVRFGEAFVQQPRYVKSRVWGAFTKQLASVTISLEPGKAGVLVRLTYTDQGAVAYAEMQAKQMVTELATDEKRFGWLKDAKVAYEGDAVDVRLPVPPRLLSELPNATGGDLAF